MALLFWTSVALIIYAYFGYPLMLYLLRPILHRPISKGACQPGIDMIIPAYNEERVIAAKIRNTLALDYPREKMNIIVISDASLDTTDEIIQRFTAAGVSCLRQEKRKGKAAALGRGLAQAENEIVVFTDASILLARSALKQIVQPFQDPHVGCVSGEDHIPEGGGEGLYGKYELLVRNLESRCGSIVGASGCFYAQRRSLCPRFTEGRAPDFLSVLETVRRGFRAVTEPTAVGLMGKVATSGDEFNRKVRTIIRGMTALMDCRSLLNPFRHGFFAIALISHKLVRWSVGWLMAVALLANMFLLSSTAYLVPMVLQVGFYTLAVIGWARERAGIADQPTVYRIPLYFCLSNLAAMVAAVEFLSGVRQELWESSRR